MHKRWASSERFSRHSLRSSTESDTTKNTHVSGIAYIKTHVSEIAYIKTHMWVGLHISNTCMWGYQKYKENKPFRTWWRPAGRERRWHLQMIRYACEFSDQGKEREWSDQGKEESKDCHAREPFFKLFFEVTFLNLLVAASVCCFSLFFFLPFSLFFFNLLCRSGRVLADTCHRFRSDAAQAHIHRL